MNNWTIREDLNCARQLLEKAEHLDKFKAILQQTLIALSGRQQKALNITVNGVQLGVSEPDRRFCAVPRKEYKLAVTFLKRGLAMEIESIELEIKNLHKQINSLRLGGE